jgi:hypothetical protein
MNMSPEIRQVVEQYLQSVSAHVGSMPADEKADLLGELREHIYQGLEARAGGSEPALDDLHALLAEMDPPAAYGAHDQAPAEGGKGTMSIGLIALCICLGSLLVALPLLLLQGLVLWIPAFLFLGGQIAALVLGIIGRSSPYGKAAIVVSSLLMLLTVLVSSLRVVLTVLSVT